MTRLSLLLAVPALLVAQGLDPSELVKPLGASDNWPIYGGDYSGKRFSSLKQINRDTVKNLSLAWSTRVVSGSQSRKPGSNLIVTGIGDMEAGAVTTVKGSILAVDGVLYVSAPDNAWALDARDGH